jgi:ABC-type antimicrobial peptide transport system permease subunit
MKKLLIGGLIGAVIVFIWGMVSWMVLPWHEKTMKHFQNEQPVFEGLTASAADAGVYIVPCPQSGVENMSPEEKKTHMEQKHEQMEKGPFAYIVYSPKGSGPMWLSMIGSFVISFVGSILVTWILLLSRIESYFGRLFLVIVFALAAGVVCLLPAWNWWKVPMDYTLVAMADLIAGWFLAGIVLAGITKKSYPIEPTENPLAS